MQRAVKPGWLTSAYDLGFRASSLGFRSQGVRSRVHCLGFSVWGSGFRAQGLDVQSLGFWVLRKFSR